MTTYTYTHSCSFYAIHVHTDILYTTTLQCPLFLIFNFKINELGLFNDFVKIIYNHVI